MKHMVYVNGKYMISVEAESNSQAEYMFLDKIPGVTTALSFDPEAMKTETFIGCMMDAVTMSYAEFEKKAKINLANVYEHYNSLIDDVRFLTEELKKLTAQIESCKDDLKEAEGAMKDYEKAARDHGIRLNGFTPYEKIADLRRSANESE